MLSTPAMSSDRGSRLIDARTVAPALLVLALAMSLGLPALDSATAYGDTMHHGDVVELAAGITLVPASGWDLASGAVAGAARTPVGTIGATELVAGGVDLSTQAAPFAGDPDGLLTRMNQIDAELDALAVAAPELGPGPAQPGGREARALVRDRARPPDRARRGADTAAVQQAREAVAGAGDVR